MFFHKLGSMHLLFRCSRKAIPITSVIIALSLFYPLPPRFWKKLFQTRFKTFLETNAALSNSQHGFRPRLSTESALTVVTDAIFSNMDGRKISLLTLCDLSKAFDSVSHGILLRKCAKLSIDSYWFKSYIANRPQSVKLKTVTSIKENISFAVPQGSILGPVLFNIYVNDMYEFVTDCKLVQYADGTHFLHSDSLDNLDTLIKNAEITLTKAKEYFLVNGLMVNPTKTQCIFIGSRQLLSHIPENVKIQFDGTSICPSAHVNNLGLHMDRYMMFDKHVNELTKKALGTLIYINRGSMNFDKKTSKIVVQSLVLSQINYYIIIWGTTNTTLLQKRRKYKILLPDSLYEK